MIGYDVLVIGTKKKKKTIYLNHILREYAYYQTLRASISYDLRGYFERVCLLLKLSRHSYFLDQLGLRRGYFERICLQLNLMSHSHLLDLLGLLG